MALLLLAFLLLSCLTPRAYVASTEPTQLYCEATPIEYDNTLSLFCQENDFTENSTSTQKGSTPLPDVSAALKSVVFTTESSADEYEPIESSHAVNGTTITVDPKNVTDLSVWAKFNQIPDNAFAKFPNLRQLHVAQFYDDTSRVVSVKDQAFHGLSKLEWLGLHLNFSHQPIPKAVFGLRSLESVGLYESELTASFAVGDNWPNLKLLTIYDSPNMTLADDAFDDLLDTLNEIDLSNIRIEKFPKAIVDLRNLTRVEIAATNLREVPPDAFFNSASSIIIIRLSRNHISVLHPTSFHGLSKLKVLQLAYNEIEVIPASIFDDLAALEVLNLAGNKIKTLPALVFDHSKHLHILDLDENPINASASQYIQGGSSEASTEYGEAEEEDEDDENHSHKTTPVISGHTMAKGPNGTHGSEPGKMTTAAAARGTTTAKPKVGPSPSAESNSTEHSGETKGVTMPMHTTNGSSASHNDTDSHSSEHDSVSPSAGNHTSHESTHNGTTGMDHGQDGQKPNSPQPIKEKPGSKTSRADLDLACIAVLVCGMLASLGRS